MTYAGLTVAYWTVLVVALLPLGCAWLAKSGAVSKPRREGGYDNHLPREWLARQSGWRARANAAQANCFEAMPFYIGASPFQAYGISAIPTTILIDADGKIVDEMSGGIDTSAIDKLAEDAPDPDAPH